MATDGSSPAGLETKTIQTYEGRSHPHFVMVSGAPGAAQTPKIDDFRPAKNHVLKTYETAEEFVAIS